MIDSLYLIAAIIVLAWASILTINASVELAKIYQLSDLFVGMAILAIGSDLPELVIAISASIDSLAGNEMSGIIVGTSIGSAYTQIGFVLGFIGLFTYVLASKRDIYLVGSILLIAAVLLILTGYDSVIDSTDGIILILVFFIYLIAIFFERKNKTTIKAVGSRTQLKSWLTLLVGFGLIAVSAEITVRSAANIANLFEISQSIIAVMIIGPGTSLPEFAISVRAIISKRHSISIGNILGSNVFDTLIPIGVAALISPVLIERSFIVFDLPGLFILTLVCLIFLVKKKGIQKSEAAIILTIYFIYLILKLY